MLSREIALFRVATTILVLAGWLWPGTAFALDSRVALADYRHASWSSKDGAPGEVNCMAQTAGGWIWLGTGSGLYRFDGVHFARFVAHANDQLQKRAVAALRADQAGPLPHVGQSPVAGSDATIHIIYAREKTARPRFLPALLRLSR